ncbi:MAG: hypothetical protein ACRD1N_01315 [Terriglobia bacterium]
MREDGAVLLLHDTAEPFASLKSTLSGISVESAQARTCAEARELLGRSPAPSLVFTDVHLPDGTWREVIAAAAATKPAAGVIVVNRFPDDLLYVQTMCSGASDFIAPPFSPRDLAYVVSAAFQSLLARSCDKALSRATGVVQ